MSAGVWLHWFLAAGACLALVALLVWFWRWDRRARRVRQEQLDRFEAVSEWHFCAWCSRWYDKDGRCLEPGRCEREPVSHGTCKECAEAARKKARLML